MGHLSGSLFRRERWRQTRASCGTLWPWAAGTRVVLIRAPVKQSTFYQIAVSLQRAKWISSLLVYRSNFIKSVGSTKANPSETCQREGLLLQQQVRAVVSPGPDGQVAQPARDKGSLSASRLQRPWPLRLHCGLCHHTSLATRFTPWLWNHPLFWQQDENLPIVNF